MTRTNWREVLPEAARIASSYDTPPTLRQVYYRLVAAGLILNKETQYRHLSKLTAEARRAGTFPAFYDGTRRITRYETFDNPAEALQSMAETYLRDRTDGQAVATWVVVEKATLEGIALAAAGDYGIPVVALRGYGSQTIIDDVAAAMHHDGRPVAVLYVGDYDPTGLDIPRDFRDRLGVDLDTFDTLAVTWTQVEEMNLPPAPGKATDPRAARFAAERGHLVQVEAEAIDPDTLQSLIADAVSGLTDSYQYESMITAESRDREYLQSMADEATDNDH